MRAFLKDLPPPTDEERRAVQQAMEDMYDEDGLPPLIVIETSAVVAIIQSETEHVLFAETVAEANSQHLPASCYVEAVMVLHKRTGGRSLLERFLRDFDVTIFGSDPAQARLAADAFERYGRGSGHPAKLNFGDCCVSYAAAVSLDAPLLFKGGDFALTDVRQALASS